MHARSERLLADPKSESPWTVGLSGSPLVEVPTPEMLEVFVVTFAPMLIDSPALAPNV